MKQVNKKLKIALLFGGKSAEHDVSMLSAKNVFNALDKNKYDIFLIGIDKSGYWNFFEDPKVLSEKSIEKTDRNHNGFLDPDCGKILVNSDVIFPVLHGGAGEDGTIQGFLKLINKPFVGPGVLGSALGMDKEVAKRLLNQAGIVTAKFITLRDYDAVDFKIIKKQLGLPLFIKPANSGSSIGVSKVKKEPEFIPSLKEAFKYDNKILIEEFIDGRQIECSILGNEKPIASIPGEVITTHEFYSYEAKYLDKNGATLEIPAKLNKKTSKQIQEISLKTFKVLECFGLSRVDLFLDKKGRVYVNEINTLPGFTSISMYPKLWEASGISYSDLIDKLIKLAIEKF